MDLPNCTVYEYRTSIDQRSRAQAQIFENLAGWEHYLQGSNGKASLPYTGIRRVTILGGRARCFSLNVFERLFLELKIQAAASFDFMQYLRQSLWSICLCLYGFLFVTLGLSWLLGQFGPPPEVDSYGFYRVETHWDEGLSLPSSVAGTMPLALPAEAQAAAPGLQPRHHP